MKDAGLAYQLVWRLTPEEAYVVSIGPYCFVHEEKRYFSKMFPAGSEFVLTMEVHGKETQVRFRYTGTELYEDVGNDSAEVLVWSNGKWLMERFTETVGLTFGN